MRNCRRCKNPFTKSFVYWSVALEIESMPWHCDICRALNRGEKKALKAANEIVAIPASVPRIEIPGANSEDSLAATDANHWNKILNWNDECDVNLMIASSLVQGGPDCNHPAMLCPNGFPIVDYVEDAWCSHCRVKVDLDPASCDEECGCQRSSGDELDLTSSSQKSDEIVHVADPEWSYDTSKVSLDDNGLDVKSVSVKTAFDEGVKNFDRI